MKGQTPQPITQDKARSSFKWNAVGQALAKLISPLVNMVLSRLLAPEIFGIVASVSIVVGLAEIIAEGGLNRVLIRRRFKDPDEHLGWLQTSFVLNGCLSTVLLIAVFFARHPLAALANSAGYEWVLFISALQIPLSSLTGLFVAEAQRAFRFRTIVVVHALSALLQGVVAILCALVGLKIWALPLAGIVKWLFELVVFFVISKNKRLFGFRKDLFPLLIKESIGYLAETLVFWLSSSIDIFFIGRVFSTFEAGIYKNAFNTATSIMAIFSAIYASVLLSFLSKIKEDHSFSELFLKYHRAFALLIVPAGAGLFIFRDQLALLFFGTGWPGAGWVLGLLGLFLAIKLIVCDFAVIGFVTKGKPHFSIIAHGLYDVCVIVCCLLWPSSASFNQFVLVRALLILVPVVVSVSLLPRIGVPLRRFLLDMYVPIVLTAGMCLLGTGLLQLGTRTILLFAYVPACVCWYLLSVYALFPARFSELRQLILAGSKKKSDAQEVNSEQS